MALLAPPVLPFGPSQEPSDAEWLRRFKPNGEPYVRNKHGGWDFQAADHRNYAVDDYEIRWVNFGPSLGNHQYVALDGTGGGWFDAHTRTRPAQGKTGNAGDFLSLMGDEGSPGAIHRHLEYLEDWRDWYSTRNRTADLHETWRVFNMLTEDEIRWLRSVKKWCEENDISPGEVGKILRQAEVHIAAPHNGVPHKHTATVELT